jgi:hypothetical protein
MEFDTWEPSPDDPHQRYGCSPIAGYAKFGDSDGIGSGRSRSVYYFLSAESRTYFMRMMEAQERAEKAERYLEYARTIAKRLITPKGNVRIRRAREIVAALGGEKA